DPFRQQTEVSDLDSAFPVSTELIIASKSVVVISRKRPQLNCRRIFLPLVIRPRSFVEPIPLLAHTKIELTIELPIALRLFTNLKSSPRALRPELIRRSHF